MYSFQIDELTGLMYSLFIGHLVHPQPALLLVLRIITTTPCVHPTVQEARRRSGVPQASIATL